MVTKCANPACTTVFRYFRGGKLFVFAPNSHVMTSDADFHERGCDAEWFWLCEQCALTLTIISNESGKPHKDGEEYIRSVQVSTTHCGARLCLHPLTEDQYA